MCVDNKVYIYNKYIVTTRLNATYSLYIGLRAFYILFIFLLFDLLTKNRQKERNIVAYLQHYFCIISSNALRHISLYNNQLFFQYKILSEKSLEIKIILKNRVQYKVIILNLRKNKTIFE